MIEIIKAIDKNNPAVQSAIITVGGMFFTFVITLLFNSYQRKKDSKERFFYEVYPKRLTVYEDVIMKLGAMVKTGESLQNLNLTKEIAVKKVSKDRHTLGLLVSRLTIYGSAHSLVIISSLFIKSDEIIVKFYKYPNSLNEIFGNRLVSVKEELAEFKQAVRKDTNVNFIDKTINSYFTNVFIRCFYKLKNSVIHFFVAVKGFIFRWKWRDINAVTDAIEGKRNKLPKKYRNRNKPHG